MLGSEVWHASKDLINVVASAIVLLLGSTARRLESSQRVLIVWLRPLISLAVARISGQMREFILRCCWRRINGSAILIKATFICSLVVGTCARCIVLPVCIHWVRVCIHCWLIVVGFPGKVECILPLLWLITVLIIACLGIVLQVLVVALGAAARPAVIIVTLVTFGIVVV